MTVVDASCVVDLLLKDGSHAKAEELLTGKPAAVAPDVIVFEVLSAIRRGLLRGALSEQRAEGAVTDLGAVPIDLVPSLPLRQVAWELRHNLSAADALFVALAAQLGEPLATKDRGMAAAAREYAAVETIEL